MFSEGSGLDDCSTALTIDDSFSHASVRTSVFLGKRFFDFCVSACLAVALFPAFLLIVLLIKLDSDGPVLFRQKRNGLNGSSFEIVKFRTMRVHSGGFLQCEQGDQRVTRIGKILRKFSIDEMPQLINVLRGEMSLIGPRPHAVEHDKQLVSVFPRFMERYRVVPGITGLAQVKGLRGSTSDIGLVEARFAADLEYVRKRSGFLDLKIILLTIPAVIAAVNAH
jgi:putative colanic acid biosysnthesis UDP-glucose lipid carrier transferase